jgi:hypothetical protein
MAAGPENQTDIVHVMQHDVPIARPFGVVELVASMRRSPTVQPLPGWRPNGARGNTKGVEAGEYTWSKPLEAPSTEKVSQRRLEYHLTSQYAEQHRGVGEIVRNSTNASTPVYMVRYGIETNVRTNIWMNTRACFNRFARDHLVNDSIAPYLYFSIRPFDMPRGNMLSASNLNIGSVLPTASMTTNEKVCSKFSVSPPRVASHLLPDGIRITPNTFYSDVSHFALRTLYERVIFPAVSHDKGGFMEEADVPLLGGKCFGPLFCGPLYDWKNYGAWYMGWENDCFSHHLDGRSVDIPKMPDWVTESTNRTTQLLKAGGKLV